MNVSQCRNDAELLAMIKKLDLKNVSQKELLEILTIVHPFPFKKGKSKQQIYNEIIYSISSYARSYKLTTNENLESSTELISRFPS
ncbi:hypothetical protein ACWE42_07495 [Sutcliffiella cohnii]